MRTSRCILYTAIVTILSLLYVFQQTEIVKLGYKMTRAEQVLESMSDHKTSLEFTLSRLESPLNLDKNLFLHNNEYEMAQSFKLVKVAPKHRGSHATVVAKATSPERSLLKRLAMHNIFAAKPAEAKTVK
jgi:hypothetical protein